MNFPRAPQSASATSVAKRTAGRWESIALTTLLVIPATDKTMTSRAASSPARERISTFLQALRHNMLTVNQLSARRGYGTLLPTDGCISVNEGALGRPGYSGIEPLTLIFAEAFAFIVYDDIFPLAALILVNGLSITIVNLLRSTKIFPV